MLTTFLNSRREGTSPRTIEFYGGYLNLARQVIGFDFKGQDIVEFLKSLGCSNGGKHAYYRTLKAFYNWLYSPKSGYALNPQNNPMLSVDSPKVDKKILPSLSAVQIEFLIEHASSLRDKAIIALFTESGLRLSELVNIKPDDIDWVNRLIRVVCKGNKEALAVYGERTELLLREWLSEYCPNGNNIWDINKWGIVEMLQQLKDKTGLPCNAHTFRRTFACLLRKQGLDVLTIKDLGRWESLEMVQRYTRSVTFQDSLQFYKAPLG
ncbi:tyrosine-type recombinase/integrase [Chloroflexota bacterium]